MFDDPQIVGVDFNGMVILRVAPQPGDLKPDITLDGIHGVGTNSAGFAGASPGGAGVVGFGGPYNGTGVVGRGGGVDKSGLISVWRPRSRSQLGAAILFDL